MNRIPTEGLKPFLDVIVIQIIPSLNEQNPDRGIETSFWLFGFSFPLLLE